MDNTSYNVPDGGYGWFVVLGAFFVHFFMDGITYAFGVFMPSIIYDFNTTRGKASIIGSLLPGFTLLFGPVTSSLTNMLGCRKTAIIGAAISGIGMLISSFSKSLGFLYFSVGILSALGFSFSYLPCMVAVNYYFDKKRALAIGIAVCGTGIGTFFFSAVSGHLIRRYDWRGAFLITAALLLNEIPAAMLLRPAYNEPHEIAKRNKAAERKNENTTAATSRNTNQTDENLAEKKTRFQAIGNSILQTTHKNVVLLKNLKFTLFLISNFITSLGFNAPYIFLVDYAINEGFDPFKSELLISILGIASMAGRFGIGYISDKKCVNRLCLYNWCLIIAGIACVVEPLSKHNYALHSLYAVLFGIFSGGYVNLTSVVCCDLLGVGDLTESFGLVLLFQGAATFIGPPLCGLIFDKTSSYMWSFISLGIAIAFSGLMLFVIPFIDTWKGGRKKNKTSTTNI